MSSLRVILESHPIKNLYAVIRTVKSELAPKLAFSADKKRHSKATLIDHLLMLDKMGLLKKKPGMYVKPPRAKPAVKAKPKKETEKIVVDLDKAKKAGIKVDEKKVKVKAKAPLVKSGKVSDLDQLKSLPDFVPSAGNPKNEPKKSKAPAKAKAPAKEKKPRAPSAWNKYVKKMGGVKKAAADKSGFEAFKKSL